MFWWSDKQVFYILNPYFRIMKIKSKVFLGITLIILLVALSLIIKDDAKLCKHPGCAKNIVVFTVDDVSLANKVQERMAGDITDYFIRNNLSATFFAIPKEMKPYAFPDNIEIAQHGYSHRNPLGWSYEFFGVSDEEAKQRVIAGKSILESYGYNISGFRAPAYHFKERNIGILEDNFEYDSSFFRNIEPGFEIPALLHDLTYFPDTGFLQQTFAIMINNFFGRPILFSMHYYPMADLLKTDEGQEYLDNIAKTVANDDNYHVMTMKELSDWQKSKTTYLYDKDTNSLQITNPVIGQTFILHTKIKPESNTNISCIIRENRQYCTVIPMTKSS